MVWGYVLVFLVVGEVVYWVDGVVGEFYFDDFIYDVGVGEGWEVGVLEYVFDVGEGGEGDGCVVEDGEDV